MPRDPWTLSALFALLAWLYLLLGRGGFWRARPRFDPAAGPVTPPAAGWPAVVAVVPARNEAPLIERTLAALLGQDYPGRFHVILVDDASRDGTAAVARRTAARLGAAERLSVLATPPLPAGWTGKLWALAQGVAAARPHGPAYLWFSDADIRHHPATLRALVGKAEAEGLALVSVMARLRCESFWERLLIPAFIFFFQMLYPFPWANRPGHRLAAAAGGCLLVRRRALEQAGGIAAVRGALIDDIALARRIKRRGPIWLGLGLSTESIRPYDSLAALWAMVARSAFAQLRHSWPLLSVAMAAFLVVFLAPPIGLAAGLVLARPELAGLGLAGWTAMSLAYRPTLGCYRRPWWAALSLPLAASLYCAMTVDSARRHLLGRGGGWKGRHYPARPAGAAESGDEPDARACP